MISTQKHNYLYAHFEKGKADGEEWAKTATPQDLDEQNGRTTLNELKENGKFTSSDDSNYSPFVPGDSTTAKYFSVKFDSSDDYEIETHVDAESQEYFQFPNDAFCAYHDGWIKSVQQHIDSKPLAV